MRIAHWSSRVIRCEGFYMMLVALHVIGGAVWFGTAMTLPFWGNRMNRADHLSTVLGVMDTVYLLKLIYIMGGLVVTLGSGLILAAQANLLAWSYGPELSWLAIAQWTSLLIFINSCVLFYLMSMGRNGRRSYFRYVPPIGYNNIFLILAIYFQMTLRPSWDQQAYVFFGPIALLCLADIAYVMKRMVNIHSLKCMPAHEFAQLYFSLLKDENMTELFRLFHDDAEFHDPFATAPVRGIKAIERFFQALGEQFTHIEITPIQVMGDTQRVQTEWVAHGLTKNGQKMERLAGTNVMRRLNGKIKRVDIQFNLADLPQVTLIAI
jgi:uncharacterized membrane protein/ketosteroid isomerase-like protein